MPNFRGRALDELKKHFPSESLADFDKNYQHRMQKTTGAFVPTIQIIRAINIAREVDALELLPCAFARLTLCDIETVFSSTASISLDRADLQRYTSGREKLRSMAEDHIFPFLFNSNIRVGNGCTQSTICVHWLKQVYEIVKNVLRTQTFLLGSAGVIAIETFPSQLYPSCSMHFTGIIDAGRISVWDQLPGCFGLGNWQELKQSSPGDN